MTTSAINGSTSNIYPGMAVIIKNDLCFLAGGTVSASGIAQSGAGAKGVVSIATSGTILLNDWTLATGSKFLVTGSVYYASGNGKISPGSGSQAVGQAISANELQVVIYNNPSSSTTSSTSTSSSTSQTTGATIDKDLVVWYGYGPPIGGIGSDGDMYKDLLNVALYGPKLGGNWGDPVGVTSYATIAKYGR